jgi:hypothetical protein
MKHQAKQICRNIGSKSMVGKAQASAKAVSQEQALWAMKNSIVSVVNKPALWAGLF